MLKLSLYLERENNRAHREGQQWSRQALSATLETNMISRDIQGLNRKGTELAIETVQAAKDTGQLTRANVLVSHSLPRYLSDLVDHCSH
jgi:hypothetical protein